MHPERWKRIEAAFNGALELPEHDRAAFLDHSLGDDAALRAEVDRLLRAAEVPAPGVESLVGRAAAGLVEPADGPDLAGATIGHYEVQHRIGTGGMGAVYLALDRRLGRKVALKVLPDSLRRDADRLQRFEHEARTLSALNHPHILTLHDIEATPEVLAIVTEYVEGETLAERLARGPLTVSEVTEVGAQVAEALAEAHHTGIVHRDIKPGNIMLTPRAGVKVLDFGLAKALGSGPAALLQTATETIRGMVLGTVRYMSPEQARGLKVDHRSDIFSLGSLLFEMTTGTPAFGTGAPVDTLQRITGGLRESPDSLRRGIPAELLRIINKCLEADPAWRYQDAGDIAVDLRTLRRALDSGLVQAQAEAGSKAPASRKWLLPAVGVVAVLAAAGMLAWRGFPPPGGRAEAPGRVQRLTLDPGEETFPSVSPDGESVVYAARGDLFLLRVGGRNAINLTTDSAALDSQPVFSPDGDQIAFRSERDGGGIFVMGATGESVRRLADFGFKPAWSPDGKLLAVATERALDVIGRNSLDSELWLIDTGSGEARRLDVPDAVQPAWSPNGRRIAYWGMSGGNRDLWTVPAAGGSPRRVTDDNFDDWNPVWSADGQRLLFASNRGGTPNLWQQRVDERTGEVRGEPEPLPTPSSSVQHFSTSADGRVLAYVDRSIATNIQAYSFDPVAGTADGAPKTLTAGSQVAYIPALSPDGAWLAFAGLSGTHQDLFVMRADGSGLRQLTDDAFKDRYPTWSADGRRLVFYSDRSGAYRAWSIAVDGSGLRPLELAQATAVYPRWSPDGAMLSFSLFGGNTFIAPASALGEARPLPATEPEGSWFIGWAWAPDSRRLAGWMGYRDRLHGGIVVYSLDDGGYTHLTGEGWNPAWLHDGRRLLYVGEQGLMLLDPDVGTPRKVLKVAGGWLDSCVPAPDDRTLYCNHGRAESDIWVMHRALD